MTVSTPAWGKVCHPMAYFARLTGVQNLKSLASAFSRGNSKIGHMALPTPTHGTVGHPKANTSRDQPMYKI